MLMLELVKQKHIMAKGAGPLIDGNNTSLGIQNLTYEDTLVYSNDSNVDRLALKEKKVSEILKDYQRILFKKHFITLVKTSRHSIIYYVLNGEEKEMSCTMGQVR